MESEKKEDSHVKVKDRVDQFHALSNSKLVVDPKKKEKERVVCVAICDYESGVDGDLSFKKGDEMLVIDKHPNHWWECEINGKRGWVSEKHVRETRMRAKSDFV